MERLTIRVPEELAEEIDRRAAADDVSTSEAARQLLRRGTEYDCIREDRDRYERQYQQLIAAREEHQELVEYVEEEWTLRKRRERRQSAPVWRRAKWWFFGAPPPDDEAEA